MTVTNITELIRSDELTCLLRLCGESQDVIGEKASDYTYFQAVCRALPLLQGHSFLPFLCRLFDLMQVDYSPQSPNAESIWMQSSDFLERTALSAELLANPESNLCFSLSYSWKENGVYPVIDATSWRLTEARDWNSWKRELNDSWKKASSCDCIKLSVDLPEKTPSLYHVDLALRSKGDNRILSAQLLRFLCIACYQENKTLVVEANRHEAELLCTHLQQLEKALALPSLILSVQTMQDLQAFLAFAKQSHCMDIRLGVPSTALKSELDLPSIASAYPIGRLFLYETDPQEIRTFSIVTKEKDPDA
ncbi:MAG: hypothetical protein IJW49_03795 [Clostridia bacterium]|nr:hypothetical protein [Clostridia bacterium]